MAAVSARRGISHTKTQYPAAPNSTPAAGLTLCVLKALRQVPLDRRVLQARLWDRPVWSDALVVWGSSRWCLAAWSSRDAVRGRASGFSQFNGRVLRGTTPSGVAKD